MGKFDTTQGCPSDATSICNKHRLNNFLYLNHLRATLRAPRAGNRMNSGAAQARHIQCTAEWIWRDGTWPCGLRLPR